MRRQLMGIGLALVATVLTAGCTSTQAGTDHGLRTEVAEAKAAVKHDNAIIAIDHVLVQKAMAADNAALVVATGRSTDVGPWNNDPFVRANGRLLIAQKTLRSDESALHSAEAALRRGRR